MPGQESKPKKSGFLKEKNNCDTPNEFGKNTEIYWIVRRQEDLLRDKTPLWLRNVAPLWLRNDLELCDIAVKMLTLGTCRG